MTATAALMQEIRETIPIQKVRAELAQLETHKRQLDTEIARLQRVLAMWDVLESEPSSFEAQPAYLNLGGGSSPSKDRTPSKREAILMVMGEQPERAWRIGGLRAALIERGLLEDEKKAKHAFDVTIGNLTKSRRLMRVAPATYKLAPDARQPEGQGP